MLVQVASQLYHPTYHDYLSTEIPKPCCIYQQRLEEVGQSSCALAYDAAMFVVKDR